MRRLFKVLVLVMSIACMAEARNNNELLKIHTIKLDGFLQELADTANEWLKRSTLGWRIVQGEPADAVLSLAVSFEDVLVMPVPETVGGCGFPRLTEDCEPSYADFGWPTPSGQTVMRTRVLLEKSMDSQHRRRLFRTDLGDGRPEELVRALNRIEKSVLKLRKKVQEVEAKRERRNHLLRVEASHKS